jgi:hydroxymethylbilane synthase
VRAERAVSRALAGSCVVPLGAYAEVRGSAVLMRAFVAAPDGSRVARAELSHPGFVGAPEALGERLAQDLAAAGAREILAALPG